MCRFSIITPVHLWNSARVDSFLTTIQSVKKQTFQDFEWIIVDDGSVVPFRWDLVTQGIDGQLLKTPHEERVIAYNNALDAAFRGEWMVFLDSDDELKEDALEKLDALIKKYPNEKMFNFGAAYIHKDGVVTYRDPFSPKRRKIGHEKFGGGNIVNGTFIFHRSVYEDLGAYPEKILENIDCSVINYKGPDGSFVRDLYMGSPYDFSAAAQLEFPELRKLFMVNHENEPNKVIKELGNPWGQDFYLFYKYTRKYHSRIFKEYLYLVHPR